MRKLVHSNDFADGLFLISYSYVNSPCPCMCDWPENHKAPPLPTVNDIMLPAHNNNNNNNNYNNSR